MKNGTARRAGGLLSVSAHGQMKGGGAGTTAVCFSRLREQEETVLVGVFPGLGSDVISAPRVSDSVQSEKTNKPQNNNAALSQQHLGLGITSLCVAMATLQLVVSPPPPHHLSLPPACSLAHSHGQLLADT